MSTIVTRYGKGSPLTWLEVDDNFTNLNTDKIQSGNTVAALTITSATINGGTITGITDLAVADGGTGLSTLTAGYIPFGAGTSAFGSSANLFWDSANNRLGIGTTSPTQLLSLSNGASPRISLIDTRTSVEMQVLADNTAGYSGTITNHPYLFICNSTERMRITSAGNVGIGTASPSQGLEVTASILAGQSVTIGDGGLYQAGSIYSDSNFGMIFRAKRASPAVEQFRWANSTDSLLMNIDTSGALILNNSTAQKTTGTTWSNPSDVRLKDNIQDYTKGLSELMQVNVKTWEYNGKGGTVKGTKSLGVIADEIKEVLPDTVDNYKAKLNEGDAEDTNIKKFDATEITWLLVKTVQEQQTIINDLKARIETLEAK